MNFSDIFKQNRSGKNGNANEDHALIALHQVTKVYQTTAGGYQALKSIDLNIHQGEFVGVIGKSGSGKSTLINMITGIDRPSGGEVWVNGTPIHRMSENQMARWRGKNPGIVFQFFQLLPALSVIENVTLPMDFCSAYPVHERTKRALKLLEMVDMADHAYKLPSALSGGQQQRVAIARALANDPPVIIADEPTGNLDSKTADSMFQLFEQLTREGKTVVMVTHDSSLARRVSRTVLITDGEVVNEYVAQALPFLSQQLMLQASRKVMPVTFQPGATIIHEGQPVDMFYILKKGAAEVLLKGPGDSEVVAARMESGQYFGEISLFNQSRTVASVRAAPEAPVEVLALDPDCFQSFLAESPAFREAMQASVQVRLDHNQSMIAGQA